MNAEDRRPTTGQPASWAESHGFVPSTFVQPTLRFLRQESAGGILLLAAAVLAIVWANSPFSASYFDLFGARIEIDFGAFHFHHLSEMTVQEWVNDAAMVLFFFVVGLEIKRELVVGDLRDPRAAALPAIAALGGMAVPAGIYLLFNLVLLPGDAAQPGAWGIPMATDIAFAVGIVALLGKRVPVAAKLFLLALAIVDDLGAIIVIALVYTDELASAWLLAAVLGLVAVHLMNRVNVRALPPYVLVGSFVWLATLESGVHATLAGVALALLTPVRSFYDPKSFDDSARPLIDRIDGYLPDDVPLHAADHHTMERVQAIVNDLQRLSRETLPPLARLEFTLAPLVSYIVVPLFALANAGTVISGAALAGFGSDPVLLGILFGLFVGKTVGVVGSAWLAIRFGLGRMPRNTSWSDMFGLAMLAGIGFTVALFVSSLALDGAALDSAKMGIYAGSLVSGIGGYLFLRRSPEISEVATDHERTGTAASDGVDRPATTRT